jgi:hypothetical protein
MIRNLRLPAALSATGVVASVGAAVALYVVLSIGPSVPEIEDIQPAAQAPLGIDDDAQALAVKMPSAKEYVEIVRRPIFSPNRRPAQVAGDIQLQTVAFELNLKLIGIIISSGEPIAIVSPGNSASFVRLTEGDSYQGWVVAGIEPQRVTLRRDAAVEYLELEYDQPPSPRKPTAPLREAQQVPAQAPQRVPQQGQQPVQHQAQQQKQTQQTQ